MFADYGYLSGDSTPLLVAKDRRTGMMFAAAVSMKGIGDPHAARFLAKWIDGLGCRKSLSEQMGSPASVSSSVVSESFVRRGRPLWTRSVLQVTLQANGIVGAVLTVGGLVKTTKAVVEANVLEGCDAGPRLRGWMVHHAAQVICTCKVGADGLTHFRRLQGRKFGTPLAGPVLERVNKFNPRCRGEVAWILPQVIPLHRGTDGKLCHQEILSQPPTWSQRQPKTLVRDELGGSQSRCTTIGEVSGRCSTTRSKS